MAIEDIKKELEERFAEPLDEFYKRRISYAIDYRKNVMDNLDNARLNLKNSLALSKEQNDHRYWIENLVGLSRVENKLQDYEASLTYLTEANIKMHYKFDR